MYQIDILLDLRMSNHLVAPPLLKGMLLDDEMIRMLEMLRYLFHHRLMLLLLEHLQ